MKNRTILELHIVKIEQRGPVTFPNYGNAMELPWKYLATSISKKTALQKQTLLEIF